MTDRYAGRRARRTGGVRRTVVLLAASALLAGACTSGEPGARPSPGGGGGSQSLPPIGTGDCPAPADLLPATADRSSGRRLPDVTLRCLGSERTVALRALGGRPAVVNLWASWCHPCRKEMPAFEKVHQDLRDKVWFLGVNTRDSEREARLTIQDTGISYPSVVDRERVVLHGLRAPGPPVTALLDASGQIRHVLFGEQTERQLREAITRYLGIPA